MIFTFQYGSINTVEVIQGFVEKLNFTFQYGSINTVDTFNSVVSGISFTFQYGSINTRLPQMPFS